jgi:hypothetical protein
LTECFAPGGPAKQGNNGPQQKQGYSTPHGKGKKRKNN